MLGELVVKGDLNDPPSSMVVALDGMGPIQGELPAMVVASPIYRGPGPLPKY